MFSVPQRNVVSSNLKKELNFMLGMIAPAHKPSTWGDQSSRVVLGIYSMNLRLVLVT